MSLLRELRRRNVIRMAGLYLVGAWLVVQVASTLLPVFEAPPWVLKVVVWVAAVGFVAALIFAWVFELTPDGLRRDADVPPEQSIAHATGRRMDRIIIVLLAAALGYFVVDKFVLNRSTAPKVAASADTRESQAQRPRALAVLPFASLGQDADSSGLAGGLHDTLITQLSKLKGLEVRSRTSVMKFKDWSGGLKPIAQELAVAVVLEGTVQHQGKRTVVNAQLIDAQTDAHLWAETFDRTSDDLFALQAEIAQRVAEELSVALSPQERKALSQAPTENREAYALYVQGQRAVGDSYVGLSEQDYLASLQRGAGMLENAVAADPKFALAWASIARTYATIAWSSRFADYKTASDKARSAAARAVALGADLPEAHFARGIVAMQLDFEFPQALREFELAAQAAPNNALYQSRLCVAYGFNRRFADATRSCFSAVALDPVEPFYRELLVTALLRERRMDDALKAAREDASAHPHDYLAASRPANVEAIMRADLAPVAEFLRDHGRNFQPNPAMTGDLWVTRVAAGDYAGALAAIDETPMEAHPDAAPTLRADALRLLGRSEEANAAYAAVRDESSAFLQSRHDVYIDALAHARVAYAQARLGDSEAARRSIEGAERTWDYKRDPMSGASIWWMLIQVHAALGDYDAALAKAKALVENPSEYPAGALWIWRQPAELHGHPGFRALMQAHGVDVSKEPFAFNRAPPAAKAGN